MTCCDHFPAPNQFRPMSEEKEAKGTGKWGGYLEKKEDHYLMQERLRKSEVVRLKILLPELRSIVADYAYEGPKFKWYDATADLGGPFRTNYACVYRDSSLHVFTWAGYWRIQVRGVARLNGLIFDSYAEHTAWSAACSVAESVADHMNAHGNTNITRLSQQHEDYPTILICSGAPSGPSFPKCSKGQFAFLEQ